MSLIVLRTLRKKGLEAGLKKFFYRLRPICIVVGKKRVNGWHQLEKSIVGGVNSAALL
jgi:hypothetical protein